MAERPLPDRLDETIGVILDRGDATAALRDDAVAPLARIALELRHYPDADFKARLRTQLRGRTTMTTAVDTGVRTGFSTVTPYLRVPEEGLVDFLVRVFDAQETMSGRGGDGGMHREVRIGDSMVMIGEGGGGGGVMPVRPMAFHVFVKDADATFQRAIAAGAKSFGEPADRAYGERSGFVADRFGNHWYIATPLGPQSVAGALRTVTPFLHAREAGQYDEYLQRLLGAVEEMRHDEGGQFRYARIRVGDAAIELGEADPMPGSFIVYVTDPDAAYHRAVDAGASSIMPMSDEPYGRVGGVEDYTGTQWFFARPAVDR